MSAFPELARTLAPPSGSSAAPAHQVEKLLMERYLPASVVVTEKYQVVYYSNLASRFLIHQAGEPTRDILKMVRKELRPPLRAAIHTALTTRNPGEFHRIKVVAGNDWALVDVKAEPFPAVPHVKLALVTFRLLTAGAPQLEQSEEQEPLPGSDAEKDLLIRHLEEQLRLSHGQLQATVEQLDSSTAFWLVLCFLLVIAVGCLQMASFVPVGGSARFYAAAAAALERPIAAIPSLAADATRDKLLKIATCGAIFVIARALCRERGQARLMLILFLGSVVLVTSYGLLMHATNGSCNVGAYLKGHVRTVTGRELCLMSGTFVSSNSFACFAGMGLVAALGLTFSRTGPDAADEFGTSAIGNWFNGPRMAWLAAAFYVLGGLLLAASRAGFIATIVGAVILGVLLVRGRWPTRPAVGWALIAVLLVIALLGLIAGGSFFRRMAALSDGDIAGRVRIWEVAVAAIRESPWLGWGLGSFPDIYTALQPLDMVVPNDLAHSTPLETVVEMGLPGAIPAFCLVVIPLAVCLRGALHRRSHRYLSATAFAVALVAVLHSSVDFSLQMPAID